MIDRKKFDNLTKQQIEFVRRMCDKVHTDLTEDLEKDPDNSQLQIDTCGWE